MVLVGGAGAHVVLTAGEAEIRDRLGGTEGGGHLESGRSQFFRKHPPPLPPINTHIYTLYTNTGSDLCIALCKSET